MPRIEGSDLRTGKSHYTNASSEQAHSTQRRVGREFAQAPEFHLSGAGDEVAHSGGDSAACDMVSIGMCAQWRAPARRTARLVNRTDVTSSPDGVKLSGLLFSRASALLSRSVKPQSRAVSKPRRTLELK